MHIQTSTCLGIEQVAALENGIYDWQELYAKNAENVKIQTLSKDLNQTSVKLSIYHCS